MNTDIQTVDIEYEEYQDYENKEDDNDSRESLKSIQGPKEIRFKNLLPRAEYDDTMTDLIDMKVFNEAELMNIIKERYECDEIYTYCGTTIISVNPYALFEGEYSSEKKEEYLVHLEKPYFVMKSIPPHLYSIAISALHELRYDRKKDTKMNLIMNGHSGAGKTEAAIYLQDFIVYAFNKSPEIDSVESKVSWNSKNILANCWIAHEWAYPSVCLW